MSDTTPYRAIDVGNTAEAPFDLAEDSSQPKGFGDPPGNFTRLTIWIDVPSTPTTGTMMIMVRPDKDAAWRPANVDPVDMVNGPRDFNIDANGIQAFKTVPISLDTTYSVRAFGKEQ
jgi:hypothetical protein